MMTGHWKGSAGKYKYLDFQWYEWKKKIGYNNGNMEIFGVSLRKI